jgi:two-component system chemotaxis response regulator CheB
MTRRNIVVIGGSAGAIGPLKVLVGALPAGLPAAVLVVQHIPPHNPSQLASILTAAGKLPCKFAEDGDSIETGCIYVAPPDRHVLIESGYLRVTRGPKENRVRPAVDALFRSAAYAWGARVIGVILSGALDDGTAGLWSIKDRGGVAMVQSPMEAEYASMPESALHHVAVDHTLTASELSRMLIRLVSQTGIIERSEPAPTQLAIEAAIALEGNALQSGVMQLGPVSRNTCPECHGVLVRIQEGRIVRYRCHTGHALSLQTLLAEVNDEVDVTLWGALRAIEERMLLLREMERIAREGDDLTKAGAYATQGDETEKFARAVRRLVLGHGSFHASPQQKPPAGAM